MFAVITPLLMTGAVAERIRFKMFIVLIVFWEVVVYYPVAHWYGDGRRGWRYLLAVPRNHANQRATTTCPTTTCTYTCACHRRMAQDMGRRLAGAAGRAGLRRRCVPRLRSSRAYSGAARASPRTSREKWVE